MNIDAAAADPSAFVSPDIASEDLAAIGQTYFAPVTFGDPTSIAGGRANLSSEGSAAIELVQGDAQLGGFDPEFVGSVLGEEVLARLESVQLMRADVLLNGGIDAEVVESALGEEGLARLEAAQLTQGDAQSDGSFDPEFDGHFDPEFDGSFDPELVGSVLGEEVLARLESVQLMRADALLNGGIDPELVETALGEEVLARLEAVQLMQADAELNGGSGDAEPPQLPDLTGMTFEERREAIAAFSIESSLFFSRMSLDASPSDLQPSRDPVVSH